MMEKDLQWRKEYLRHESDEYLLKTKVAPKERSELLEWVKSGNSVYDNPWYLYSEDGHLMDYITAMRDMPDIIFPNSLIACSPETGSEISLQDTDVF